MTFFTDTVPYGCIDPEQALQHFVQVFEER